jgi:hypothetical protein
MKKCVTAVTAVFVVLLAAQAYAQDIQRLSAQFLDFAGSETASNVGACPNSALASCGGTTVPGTGGSLAYSTSVFVPFSSGPQTMYVTISAVGDNHSGQSNYVSCNVDGPTGVGTATTVCNPQNVPSVDGAPPGWVTLTHHFAYDVPDYISDGVKHTTSSAISGGDGGGGTGDMHDNDYYYTWCKRVTPGTHTINLRLGNHSGPSSPVSSNNFVFFEKAFVYIDVSPNPPFGACTLGHATPPPS